ncbi:MAG TPA: CHAD domain-containing protein, partial [Gemmata sp.]|nr:CHAD domain-containing protein [Gemmata sp.]
ASRRIWKLYRRVLREGAAITPASPPEAIHDLRKTAKKLRYLMEFFRSLYPTDKIGPLVKILKGLQDHLGAYQDVHVQIGQLRQFSAELRQADAPTETLLALGAAR